MTGQMKNGLKYEKRGSVNKTHIIKIWVLFLYSGSHDRLKKKILKIRPYFGYFWVPYYTVHFLCHKTAKIKGISCIVTFEFLCGAYVQFETTPTDVHYRKELIIRLWAK